MDTPKDEIESIGLKESAGFKNLIAIRDYTQATRYMFRLLQEENKRVIDQVRQQNLALEALKLQITQLQIKLYQNNATQNTN